MDKLWMNTVSLTLKPEDYLRPCSKLYDAWVNQVKDVYNLMKIEEQNNKLSCPTQAVPQLFTDGMDMEQIWQQIELQNKGLLTSSNEIDGLDDSNLCYLVAKLHSLAKFGKLVIVEDDESYVEMGGGDSGVEEGMEDDIESEESLGEKGEDDEDEDDLKISLTSAKEKQESAKLFDFDNFDDSDEEDNFDALAKEGDDSDDDSTKDSIEDAVDKKGNVLSEDDSALDEYDEDDKMQDQDEEAISEPKKKRSKNIIKPSKKFQEKNEVDSTFFNVRESEWVADNDMIGENYDGVTDDEVDMMADIPESDDGEDVMYDAFFDPLPNNEPTSIHKQTLKVSNKMKDKKEVTFQVNTTNSAIIKEKEVAVGGQLMGTKIMEVKSTFEKECERELELIEELEEENIVEKPWYLKGEVQVADRPENSALEEHLEYDIAVRQKPVITEDTTSLIEKIILSRIKTSAWDDVERKIKPMSDPFEYKKKILLDQDKSKKSLAEIYEEEYQKQQTTNKGDDEAELKEHEDIKKLLHNLFNKLDALSNYHFTPKQRVTEVKIVSNLPAISMEESAPTTATDASLLAPQEILAPEKGELLGDTEKTKTDRRRDRRSKKSFQKKKAKKEEQTLQGRLRKMQTGMDAGRRLDVGTTVKVVERAVKSGQVKMLEIGEGDKVKSSQKFFKKLQDDVNLQSKKKVGNSKANKNKLKKLSVSKILL